MPRCFRFVFCCPPQNAPLRKLNVQGRWKQPICYQSPVQTRLLEFCFVQLSKARPREALTVCLSLQASEEDVAKVAKIIAGQLAKEAATIEGKTTFKELEADSLDTVSGQPFLLH
jgi:hypothetical protein